MRPPMPKLADGVLTLKQPQVDENGEPMTDDYGNPLTVDRPIKQARIRQSTKFIQARDGQQHKCVLEIDFPTEIAISEGDSAEYHPTGAALQKGKIISINETLNLAGNHVYFRTAYVE